MVSELIATLRDGHVPAALLDRLSGLHAHLAANIKGQDHVLDRVCSVLIRGELGLAHSRRPKGSILAVGPTGVGKTELTNVFTAYLFGGGKPIRFDMSEYQLQGSVDKLIGSHADDPGLLGRALQGKKHGTLLFDEIEKAHPLVLDLFLQILEDARITFATGETVDLSRFYVICTSNIGSAETMRMQSAPFASIERTVLMRVGQQLRPELVGRITEKIVFNRLDFITQRAICEQLIGGEIARLSNLGYVLELDRTAVEFLVRRGYHRTLGARPMRTAVERYIQDAVANALLSQRNDAGRLVVGSNDGGLVLTPL